LWRFLPGTTITGGPFSAALNADSCLILISDNDPVDPLNREFSVLLFEENFNNTNDSVPPGWILDKSDSAGINPFNSWFTTGYIGGWFVGFYSLDSTDYLMLASRFSDPSIPENEFMISPVIDASEFDELYLEFDQYFYGLNITGPQNRDETILVDVWDGSNWQNVYRRDANPEGGIGNWYAPDSKSINISQHINSNMQVRFGYKNGQYEGWWVLDNISVYGKRIGAAVAVSTSDSAKAYFGPDESVHFFDEESGKIIASLQNLSTWDYSCVDLFVDREGIGTTPFDLNDPDFYLMDKTIRILPANNNPSGMYELSMYFSAAEISGWLSGTGNLSADLGIIKSGGAIANVSPANPNANGNTNYYASSNQLSTFAGGDWVLSGQFSTGFSGFGAGL
jgi:hypothetical protein